MTMVVAYQMAGAYPVVIGDLLLTQPDKVPCPPLPIHTGIHFPSQPEAYPCALDQKVNLIGNRMAIGWAGRREVAKEVITQLYSANKVNCLDYDYLASQLDGVEGAMFAGYLIQDDRLCCFHYNPSLLGTHPSAGEIMLLGSGHQWCSDLLDEILPSMRNDFETFNSFHPGVALGFGALTLTGNFLSKELADGTPILSGFGGGYEIAYLGPQGFEKLDGVTYAFWEAEVLSEAEVRFSLGPRRVCAYNYSGDILSIRSLAMERASARHWATHVAPIYKTILTEEEQNLPLAGWNNIWLCNYVAVRGLSIPQTVCRTFCRLDNTKDYLYFEERPDGIEVGGSDELLRLMTEDILNRYREEGGIESVSVNSERTHQARGEEAAGRASAVGGTARQPDAHRVLYHG